jgi:glycosyltransferase involved in cell wall biosynthesis
MNSEMAHGSFPREYISNPSINKPIEDIYKDLDSFTWEMLPGDSAIDNNVDFTVVLPPLQYEGCFVKGLFFSRAIDYLYDVLPGLRDLFLSMAYSMFCSYPWAASADAYLACYRNPAREAWFRRERPERAHIHFIPLAEIDHMDEYRMAPVPGLYKNIDVLCVSRLQDVKNLTMIARALKIYRSKYRRPIRMTLVTGSRNGISPEKLPLYARQQLEALGRVLGRIEDYIDIYGRVDHWTELPQFYSRAKVYVLGSLIEGKNRGISEALSCDVPIVCFREFNQYARQGHPILPDGTGINCAYDAESLAEAIHTVLENPASFSPRLRYLKKYGRHNFLNQCLDYIDYYRTALPDFVPGQHGHNPWIDAALYCNYGRDLHTFLYRPGRGVARASGVNDIKAMLEFYQTRTGN